MASSNIKLFDENKGNMLTDTEFNISNQRMNGLQTGVASSQLQNKAMYQASLVAYAIAQIMMQNGKNANDSDAVSAFVANLSGTMLQKVYDIATTEEAKAGVATGKWMSPALVKAAIDTFCLKTSGGTLTGPLYLNGDPTNNLQAATKQYVDNNKYKKLYEGSVSDNSKILSQAVFSKYKILFGACSITYGETRYGAPSISLDGLGLLSGRTQSEGTTDYGALLLFNNILGHSFSMFFSADYTEVKCSVKNGALAGLVTFNLVTSASLTIYGI